MKRIVALVLVLFAIISFCSCNNEDERYADGKYSYINGKKIVFVDANVKKEWKEPLAKLLANVLVPYGEGGDILGYEAAVDPDAPAIADGLQFGLLDLSHDGVPELLVQPYGAFGSSGTETYVIYDIFSGQCMGSIEGGNGGSWCEIYYTETDEIKLVGQYWLRYGWSERERFVYTTYFNEEKGEYGQKRYLSTYHSINGEQTNIEDEDPDDMFYTATWVETYPETLYFVNGEPASIDKYYAEYDWFAHNCIRIHETELKLFRWEDVAEDGDDYVTRGAKMAEALVTSEQEFVAFKK